MKTAVLQVTDTGPLESLVVMLQTAGYACFVLGEDLKRELRGMGCDTVLDIKGLVQNWGYEEPRWGMLSLHLADVKDMDRCDLYVDVKAQRNGPKIWKRWPRLRSRTLWYRINGAQPEHVIKANGEDCGDEINPGMPILTPNQWYKEDPSLYEPPCGSWEPPPHGPPPGPNWGDTAYVCWPPFYGICNYLDTNGRAGKTSGMEPPICLIHNIQGWGYTSLIEEVRKLGVRCYGAGSPDGLIPHHKIPFMLAGSLAMVHLKSNDAPGYALYEALAAACPVIVPRRLIWRSRMEELFIPGKTCLTFDKATHAPIEGMEVEECVKEIRGALQYLENHEDNWKIGLAGHERLKELLWSEEKDGDSLRIWLGRHFPN